MTFANFWPEWVWLAENDVLEDEVSVTSELYGRKTRAHNLLRILVLSTAKLHLTIFLKVVPRTAWGQRGI